jgi:NTP pyrophosphatase (non-canonical NTP hydrolase)
MRQYTDLGLTDDLWILKKIINEKSTQLGRWGIQRRSAFEWLTYLAEEVGEVAEAITEYEYREGTKEDVVKEAVQVATLALTIAEMFERGS